MSLARFMARHALADFRHRARLFQALADGSCAARDLPRVLHLLPCCGDVGEDALPVTPPRRADGAYAASLSRDRASLRTALQRHAPHHRCDLRVFDMVPGFRFHVVECAEDGAVLGCCLDYDPRLTDEETWSRFFG